jgi:acetyl esterase/lipase
MVSPQFDKVRRILRERRVASPPSTDVVELRRRMTEAVLPAGEDVTVEAVTVGGVPAERVAARTARADRVVLYAHGGGFCLGSPVTHRKLAGDISRASGAVCVVVDYRLAPEHPFPAPIEDLVAVYGAVLESHPAESVLFAGDSAGGALIVLAASRLKDARLPMPAGLVGLTPWTDYLCAGPSFVERADADPITSVPELANYRNWFLGAHAPTDPRISPVHADLRGLPPMLLHGGGGDVMCDDAAVLAAHARAAGVDVTHRQVPEMVHVWHVFAGRVPEATEAVEEIGAFAQRRFAASLPGLSHKASSADDLARRE